MNYSIFLVIIYTIVGFVFIVIGFLYYRYAKENAAHKKELLASADDEKGRTFGGRKKRKLKK